MNGLPVLGTEDYLKLSPSARIEAMKNGQFQAPKRGTAERSQFEARLFNPGEPQNEPQTNPETNNSTPPNEPQKEPQNNGISLEDLKKELEAKNELLAKSQEIINKINATNGNQGRRLKDLERELAEVQSKISAPPVNVASEIDSTPEFEELSRPDPLQFEDGVLDPEYQKKHNEYLSQLERGFKKSQDTYKDMKNELEKIRADAKEAKKFAEEIKSNTSAAEGAKAWSELSEQVQEIQKETGMHMTIPWVDLNSKLLIIKDESADPDLRRATQEFVDTLPQSDLDMFRKIVPIVKVFADFGSGVPVPRFKNVHSKAFRGHLEDSGIVLTQPVQSPKPVLPTITPGVSPMGTPEGGTQEPRIQDVLTGKERQERFSMLNRQRRENPEAFNRDSAKRKEFEDLKAYFLGGLR